MRKHLALGYLLNVALMSPSFRLFNISFQERPRPHFTVMAPMTAKNPITGAVEPFFPKQDRFRRIFTSSMVILLLVGCHFFVFCSQHCDIFCASFVPRFSNVTGSPFALGGIVMQWLCY